MLKIPWIKIILRQPIRSFGTEFAGFPIWQLLLYADQLEEGIETIDSERFCQILRKNIDLACQLITYLPSKWQIWLIL